MPDHPEPVNSRCRKAKMITPKVRMGSCSVGGAAFLRKAISRIGERNVGQKKNWRGIPTIYADDVVYSQITATDQIRVGAGLE